MLTIMVTGGAGYIGSHACLALLRAGFEVIVVDNLSNSSSKSLERVEFLSHRKLKFYELDIGQTAELDEIFKKEKISAVMHFAGLKSVGESNLHPIRYYQQNFVGTLSLIEAMRSNHVYDLIFSSSATVYGEPESLPLTETARVSTTNPYGRTKLFIEELLKDISRSDPSWRITLLRYFNPVGADPSGMIGEDPLDIPNNLVPYLTKVALGELEKLSVFGNDYPTKDGTGVRDYIHVEDLVLGHLCALQHHHIQQQSSGVFTYNLGTGQGYSVLEMIHAFEQASQRKIPYQISNRRAGDVAECYADASKAKQILNWEAKKGIQEMAEDSWRWQQQNPKGYRDELNKILFESFTNRLR